LRVAGGDRHLVRAVGIEALDRRLGLGLDAEIARQASAHALGPYFSDRPRPRIPAGWSSIHQAIG
jgi:hypothetical protein